MSTTIVVPAIFLVVATLGLLLQMSAQMYDTDWVEHTDLVMLSAQNAKIEFLKAEDALRAFLISAESPDRTAVQNSWNRSQTIIKQMAALVSDNPAEEQRLITLDGLEDQWFDAVRDGTTGTDAEKRDLIQRASDLGAKVLAELDEITSEEQRLRVLRDNRRDTQYTFALWSIPIFAIMLVLGLTWAAWREIQRASVTFEGALKNAEEANRAKTNFLAVVSHELRNPLNSILLWCNALLTGAKLEDRTDRGVNAISRAAKAQAQLIEDLLDLSRIESGQMRLDVQQTDLGEVVRGAVDSMTPAAEAKSIAMQVVIDPHAGTIVGDAQRLQQAVWNLLSNAIKFTPKGGKVQVRLERINSHLEIVVADNGQGLEAGVLENVFDRFWQGQVHSTGERGMGLGLSIVRHIVNLHGGTVTAHSDGPGKGSVFVIRLPLPVVTLGLDGLVRRHPTVTSGAPGARIPRLEGISALVVDDDPETRDAMNSLLASLGSRVTTVESVERAIAELAKSNPDVLISDLGMPGRDGYSLIREIREREKDAGTSQHLPVVALTAYGRVEDRVEIFSSGFDSHVVKPVDPAELAAVIKRLVESHRTGDKGSSEARS